MTATQWATLGSAILGAAGTIILFFSSYVLEPLEGAPFNGPQMQVYNDGVRARNKRRLLKQRVGLVFLCASFVVQGVTAFL